MRRAKDVINNKLSEVMQRRRINQTTLAQMLGVTPSAVFHWSNGENVPLLRMREIAAVLYVGVSEIWPSVVEPVDLEYQHQLITERLGQIDYHSEEYRELCNERNTLSVKIYINAHKSELRKSYKSYDNWDNSPLPESTYGRMSEGSRRPEYQF